MARRKRTRAEWTKEIARYHASGQSAEAFAARRGLNVSTLRWWSSEVRKAGRSTADQLEIREVLVAEPDRHESTFEIGIGSVVMRFEVGTDPRYVAALVATLALGASA